MGAAIVGHWQPAAVSPFFGFFRSFLVTVGDIITLLTLRHKCCYVMATTQRTIHLPTCALKKAKTMKSEGAEGAKGCDGCHHCYVNVTTF